MIANGAQKAPPLHGPRVERPRLLPFNRRLRHLQGLSLRNLVLTPQPRRPRTKTIDDEALPYALKTPSKLPVADEGKALHQSRSFTNLKFHENSTDDQLQINGYAAATKPGVFPQTPDKSKIRRRSTLDWMNASPRQRIQNLETAVARHRADVFFSLHVEGFKDPIYVSEMIENVMNPDFRFFDLNACSSAVTRLAELTIKFWARPKMEDKWIFLVDMAVNLRALQFIGTSMEDFMQHLPDNCVLFHLSDGIYTFLNDAPSEPVPGPVIISPSETVTSLGEPTSSYDALMKLSTLDDCIQDAIATREKLTADINALIASDKERFSSRDDLAAARDRISTTQRDTNNERRQIKQLTAKAENLRSSIRSRSDSMAAGRARQSAAEADLASSRANLAHAQSQHQAVLDSTTGQRRRICEDLLAIYPIEPIPNRPLHFTIRGLSLPNSLFTSDHTPAAVSAALGHVAHLTALLSAYLAHPLPYPLTPRASSSSVRDPISLVPGGSRVFPLHLDRSTFPASGSGGGGTGSPFYRFEYAVFLLNKDIELLAAKLGLRVLDIRQTLPNLKYLLYVATAGGTAEMPARKAGGVRGLLRREEEEEEGEKEDEEGAKEVWKGKGKGTRKGRLGR